MKFHTLALALIGIGSTLSAQAAAGDFVAAGYPNSAGGGGLFLIDAVKGTMTPLTGVTGELKWLHSIDQDPFNATFFVVGTNGSGQTPIVTPNIYSVILGAGKLIASKKLNTVALTTNDAQIIDLCIVGKEVFFLTKTRLARMPLAGGAPTTIATYKRTAPVAMCTDGRFLYVNFDNQGYGRGSIFQVDPTNTKHWAFKWSSPPINLDYVRCLEMSADNQVMMIGRGNFSGPDLYKINIATQKETSKIAGFYPGLMAQAWKVIEDPQTRDIVALGRGASNDEAVTLRNGKPLHAAPYGAKAGNLRGLTVRRSPWLHRFGNVCLSSIKNYEFYGNSVPEIGNSKYALTFQKTGASVGLLLIGAHGKLPGPLSLNGLGMTGCDLGVLPIIAAAISIPASGSLTLPLGIPSSIGPGAVDVQLIVTEASANKAGLVSTQVGSIIIR